MYISFCLFAVKLLRIFVRKEKKKKKERKFYRPSERASDNIRKITSESLIKIKRRKKNRKVVYDPREC